MNALIFVLGLTAAPQASPPAPRIDIVSVTGCLKEAPSSSWTLVSATDPVASSANAPAAKEIPATPPAGKNEFRLIGVSEFNLPAHKDHTVIVKGLLIKATPMNRVNVTSVTMVSPSCAAPAK
jgi:hypothetical protein